MNDALKQFNKYADITTPDGRSLIVCVQPIARVESGIWTFCLVTSICEDGGVQRDEFVKIASYKMIQATVEDHDEVHRYVVDSALKTEYIKFGEKVL